MPNHKKPTALKELQGTARADRANPLEPRPSVGIPDAPAWIDEDPVTRQLFDQVTKYIVDMKVATQVDGLALSLLADQLSLYLEIRNEIRSRGVMLQEEGSTGQTVTKPNPLLPQLNSAYTAIVKMLREYGLTAASRTNVSMIEEREIDTFEEFLK